MLDIRNVIDNEILSKGIWLGKDGINTYVWKKNEIMKILQIFKQESIAVLGGDTYEEVDGKIVFIFDGWSIDDNGMSDYCNKSIDKAKEYINNYEKNNDGCFWYSLVFAPYVPFKNSK